MIFKCKSKSFILPAQPFMGRVPQFHALQKLHKLGPLKIRPIISNIEIYCEKLLLHLKTILNILFLGTHSVENSYKFVDSLSNLELTEHHRLASLDVESPFTRVPVQDTLGIVS